MRVFLASIPLEAAKIVIIGGGEPALAKLRLFLNTPAQLLWFAPDGAPPKIETPLAAPEPLLRAPEARDLAGARLVFMALDDADELTRLGALARAAGAQVNVVDKPHLSDFQTPALIDRDEVVIGVGSRSDGACPPH